MSLASSFTAVLASLQLPPGPVVVAVSGGVDSVVLLDLLQRTRAEHHLDPIVAHVDHGMQPVDTPRSIVERLATSHRLPLHTVSLGLGPTASETTARVARLRWLRRLAREHQAGGIFLGHHADDQAETVLMRLLRGSGPMGLAGMTLRRGMLMRPLLGVTREDLVRYARDERLEWWEDPANAEPRHLRSWIRQALLPQVKARLPDVGDRLARTARLALDDRRGWRAALEEWPGLGLQRDPDAASLDWTVLGALPVALRIPLAQALLRGAGCPVGPQRIARALAGLQGSGSGARTDLGDGWRLELAFGRLRVLPPEVGSVPAPMVMPGSGEGQLAWGGWTLSWSTESAPARQERASSTAWFTPAPLAVRPWLPGDRVAPLGGRGHRLAVRCFQDAHVPRQERQGWPILEGEGAIAWIPGVCRSNLLLPAGGEAALRLEVRPRG